MNKKMTLRVLAALLTLLLLAGCTPQVAEQPTDVPQNAPVVNETTKEPVPPVAPVAQEPVVEEPDELPDYYEMGFELFDAEGNMLLQGRDAVGINGVVTSGKIEASRAGLEIIEKGGNAVDAAVATSFALGVTEPAASGIGGGGFMTVRTADGKTVFLDGREIAPMAADPDIWPLDENGKVIDNVKTESGKANCTPTLVATLLYAFEHYGSGNVTLADILAPSIKLAEEGFAVSPNLHSDSESSMGKLGKYNNGEGLKTFMDPATGFPYETGATIKNPNIAKVYKLIAEKGLAGFYEGEVAQAIVDANNESGGVMTLEDLKKAATEQPVVRDCVTGTYHGYQIIAPAPVSSGGTHIVEILNILENFDIQQYAINSAEYMHLFAEAFKIAFADRKQYMGDPAFVEVPIPIEGLTSKEYAKARAAEITMDVSNVFDYGDAANYESNDTTHFSIGDKEGNMVSMTQTVNGYFGSGVVPTGYGFPLNNQCSDFGIGWGLPNSIEGGKKPLSSMSPTIVLDPEGNPFLIVGSPGGTRIFPTVAQIIVKCIDYKLPIQEAVNSPRMWCDLNDEILYEDRISPFEIGKLVEMGHKVKSAGGEYSRSLGSVNAILYGENDQIFGAADPRRDGKALGY